MVLDPDDRGTDRGSDAVDAPGERSARRFRVYESDAERPAAPVSRRGDPGAPRDVIRPQAGEDEGAQRSFVRRHLALISLGALAALVLVAAGYVYWDNSSHFETTDDAFVDARHYPLAPKVSGYVVAAPVTDNQHVGAGDVIARIDDRDYQVALANAQAAVDAAQAGVSDVDAQIEVQKAQIAAGQAKVDQAKAGVKFAQEQATRYSKLATTGSGTVQNAQQFATQAREQEAAFASAQAALVVAQRQLDALGAQRKSAMAKVEQAKAQRDQARLNLSYTVVKAAEAGRVVKVSVAKGELAQAGTALAILVPDHLWVTANFKETQLDRMRPGQPVDTTIDAYPDRTIHGRVASVQPGSGTAFSLLPAENATGNYVKIVQRVPVKIVMNDPPDDVSLGPGMSVEPTVRVDPSPSLYERLEKLW